MKTKSIYFTIILGLVLNFTYAQNVLSDFLIFESNYSELPNYEKSLKGTENVFFNTTQSPVFTLVNSILKEKGINNLHLYLDTKPGELYFGSTKITNFNIMDYSEHFIGWKHLVKGRVIIHSNVVFSGDNGIELKQKLEEITGLPFELRTNERN